MIMAHTSGIFKKENGERIEILCKDVKCYRATDYPTDNGTIIFLKSGSDISVQEDFFVVDAVFDL